MSVIAAVPLAMLGLVLALWQPCMATTAIAVLCGYAAGLMMRFEVRATRQDHSSDE
jgi:hypothetical protein